MTNPDDRTLITDLTADWIVGIVDGEGCFSFSLAQNHRVRTGWSVLYEFVVTQHVRSSKILHSLKAHFDCGKVDSTHPVRGHIRDVLRYRVTAFLDLQSRIVPFFNDNPLRTAKQQSFELWKQALDLVARGQHLNSQGLLTLSELSARINPAGRSARRLERDGTLRSKLSKQANDSRLHAGLLPSRHDRGTMPNMGLPPLP